MNKLKDWKVWASLVMTMLGLAASNGMLGTGSALQATGWGIAMATILGVHMMAPAPGQVAAAQDPAAPPVPPAS